MKFLKCSLSLFFVFLLAGVANGQTSLPDLQTFTVGKAILDLRNTSWLYVHDTTNKISFETIKTQKDWAPVKVGRNWDLNGHAELRRGTVWVKTRVFIPKELKGNTISFVCTLVGGSADLYVNGSQAGEHVQYYWGNMFPGSVKIEISNVIHFGQDNEITVRCDNQGAVRSIGLLGLVGLERTLPFLRNSTGGISTIGNAGGKFSVLLHYAGAVLSVGSKTQFSSTELSMLQIPPYGLREDEMICVVPSTQVDISKLTKVDLALMHYTADKRPVSIKSGMLPSTCNQNELITLPLQVTAKYTNPFEQKEIDVTADIVTPSGKVETIHGFFAQDYKAISVGDNEEILLPAKGLGTPWRLNYRPREVGEYKVQLTAKDQTGIATYYAGNFTATSKASRGFLHVSKKDPRFFEFDSGESFYATGPSGWYRQNENWMFGGNTRWVPVEQVKKYYDRKGANRSSFEYLARWHFGSLYLKGGFIDAYVMWKLESATRSMEANGIYWITYGKPAAGRTYFNSARAMEITSLQTQIVRQNGLPTMTELEFEPGGRIELYHFVSRLGDSPAIWMWNNAEEDGEFNPAVLPYHSYIRSLDVYKHAHGVSEGEGGIKFGGDAIILSGWYNSSYDRLLSKYLPLTKYQVPVVDIEGSVNRGNDLYNMKNERIRLIEDGYHNHLWLCLFMKMAGGGTDWFNRELDENNMMFHSLAISKYLDGESLTKTHWQIDTLEISPNKDWNAFALKSENKTLAWIIRPPLKRQKELAAPILLNIPVEKKGKYLVEFWDTLKGEVTKKINTESSGGMINITIDDLKTDVAIKAIFQ